MNSQHKKPSFESFAIGSLIFIFTFIFGIGCMAWQSADKSANESNAVHFISSFRNLQNEYAAQHQGQFAEIISEFGGNDYTFTVKMNESNGTNPAFYSINADPKTLYGFIPMGTRHFYYDSTLGSIKATEENRQATANDPSI